MDNYNPLLDDPLISVSEEIARLEEILENVYEYMVDLSLSNVYSFEPMGQRSVEDAAIQIIEIRELIEYRLKVLKDKDLYEQWNVERAKDKLPEEFKKFHGLAHKEY